MLLAVFFKMKLSARERAVNSEFVSVTVGSRQKAPQV
jgi:hypothetical protein